MKKKCIPEQNVYGKRFSISYAHQKHTLARTPAQFTVRFYDSWKCTKCHLPGIEIQQTIHTTISDGIEAHDDNKTLKQLVSVFHIENTCSLVICLCDVCYCFHDCWWCGIILMHSYVACRTGKIGIAERDWARALARSFAFSRILARVRFLAFTCTEPWVKQEPNYSIERYIHSTFLVH